MWHGMRKDVSDWVKGCTDCQLSKVGRHNSHPVRQFEDEPSGKFTHIHIDIVGPLPESTDHAKYLLTIVDRATRWPMAIPMKDMTAQTVSSKLLSDWVAQFGVPTSIVSDRGRQFVSSVWSSLLSALGTEVKTTTAFHPEANGMVERFHRSLKSSLMAKLSSTHEWVKELPAVMLGIRTAFRDEFGASIAEVVLGQELAVPGKLLVKDSASAPPHPFFRKIDEY